jgi:uncharacterized protein YdhG (YjbR/CyaY superfamily)
MAKTQFASIDEYIKTFPPKTRTALTEVRQTIRAAAPDAVEAISYQMPTFKLEGRNLVHFGGWQSHVGFYPIPSGMEAFAKELSKYKQGKGSVQFPLDEPMPLKLITRIVKFRVKEERARLAARAGRAKGKAKS